MQLGKLGSIIANKLIETKGNLIDNIFYITTPLSIKPKESNKIQIIEISSSQNLLESIKSLLEENQIDFFIHSMAVSDYTVDYVTSSKLLGEFILQNSNISPEQAILNNENIIDVSKKISSNEENLIIKLKKTPKIISEIKKISPNIKLIGFKLLNNVPEKELEDRSMEVLQKNNCELVIGNDSRSFVNSKHRAIFINKDGVINIAETKEDIANKLVRYIFKV